MRVFFIFIFLCFSALLNAQDQITKRDGEQIDCVITKVDEQVIYFDFHDGERRLSSFIPMTEVRSYQRGGEGSVADSFDSIIVVEDKVNEVLVDTTRYVEEVDEWVNLVVYSPRIGVNATGWGVDYYGYNLTGSSRWGLPLVVGIEGFDLRPDYFDKTGYYQAEMSYMTFGVSPFYRLGDKFYLQLGVRLIYGEEELTDFSGDVSSNMFFGLNPSQGIVFIPESKAGVTLGIGIYEKVLSSDVYNNDVGVTFQLGIKF
ncbi:hypothetical protein BY457_102274 [Marinilabilia salmonicolor]|jgi:hypothetical protein|uniref:hypothetical protein n=1 Tax=Marinilabilia salmonicolor TaxID=989 RepID=UPI000D07302C|nr:hypothetical protein [Marinilabilia salmonicolor]PRZ01866.1 hypothetical protein BY457_102274 [Marinilabilia salmonicolor]